MISVLTPTFNRREKLADLYKSLEEQTSKEFEWVVVDDGSSDDTESYITGLKATFPIWYYRKENGGKHTALNYGLTKISNELTFIVDSDDRLPPAAIETICRYHKKYAADEELCGYSFLKCYPDGTVNGKLFVPDEKIASYIDVRINADDTRADKAEVFKTSCLKEFPFPEYPGEKFLSEDVVWMRLARKYKMVHINKAIYIADYYADGLTHNRRRNNIQSPRGCMTRALEYLHPDIKIRYRSKAVLQYLIYGRFAGFDYASLLAKAPDKLFASLFVLPGDILYRMWKRQYTKEN